MRKLRVAIIGQGRSGRDIHGQFFKSTVNTQYEVAAVVEANDYRRQKALSEYPGCEVFKDYTELYDRKDLKIDFVINASFSQMHYPISKELLKHGFNVLVEKPMGRTYRECLDLIKAAKDNGVIIAAFQQTFVNPFHLGIKKLVASGRIGKPLQYDITYSGFSRRWDWQTLQANAAGGLYNTGPHPMGLALDYLDFDENITIPFSRLGKGLTSGDSDDYAKVIITAPGKAVVDVEVSSHDAYKTPYMVKVQGTLGTLTATWTEYQMTYVIPGENIERPVDFNFLSDEKGNPAYCSEELIKHEEKGEFEIGCRFDSTAHVNDNAQRNDLSMYDQPTKNFYDLFYETMVNGAPLAVTPEQSAKVIWAIETVHNQNPLDVEY